MLALEPRVRRQEIFCVVHKCITFKHMLNMTQACEISIVECEVSL